MSDVINRHGVSAWLENIGYPKLAEVVMDKKRFPSIQPEIIKCGECKYAHITYSGEVKYCDFWETEDPIYMSADNFCSNAERIEWR